MLFNSYIFIFIFLPITFFVYFYLNNKKKTNLSKFFLVFSSLLFYSWWNLAYLPIILGSMTFNYVIGKKINKSLHTDNTRYSKKFLLVFGISLNILLLGYFKYADFFIENINIAFRANLESLNLLLPLAISFFTFQQIAYLIDCYRQEVNEYGFQNYAIFVTFFPQLIAGPIVHHKEMMPQFMETSNKVKNYQNIVIGLFIFSIGLFKKVIIADTFSVWVNEGFDVQQNLDFFEAWATSLSYSFQLYFDFSGYTDMAIGLALLFNIKLPVNFNSPYKATNIQDFWRRWHITLSRFLRNYVYIPLGGNKQGNLKTFNNIIGTFLIGGLWHGAGWTFIFWGLLHGIAMVIHRLWSKIGIKLWPWLGWLITFNFVNIAWIFFRARDWEDAIKVLAPMFNLKNIESNNLEILNIYNSFNYWFILFAFLIVLLTKNTYKIYSKLSYKKIKIFQILFIFVLFSISFLQMNLLKITSFDSSFLYFNF